MSIGTNESINHMQPSPRPVRCSVIIWRDASFSLSLFPSALVTVSHSHVSIGQLKEPFNFRDEEKHYVVLRGG